MILKNPSTLNRILVGAEIRPYAFPMLSAQTRNLPLSSVVSEAVKYADMVKADEYVIDDFKSAKKLIGAVRQIAAFDQKLAI